MCTNDQQSASLIKRRPIPTNDRDSRERRHGQEGIVDGFAKANIQVSQHAVWYDELLHMPA